MSQLQAEGQKAEWTVKAGVVTPETTEQNTDIAPSRHTGNSHALPPLPCSSHLTTAGHTSRPRHLHPSPPRQAPRRCDQVPVAPCRCLPVLAYCAPLLPAPVPGHQAGLHRASGCSGSLPDPQPKSNQRPFTRPAMRDGPQGHWSEDGVRLRGKGTHLASGRHWFHP